jgi:hypothetical protein
MERFPLDPTGFDRLARALGAALPRRAALGGLVGGLASLSIFAREVGTKRKRTKKKKKRRCTPNCAGKVCGSNGCGGTCGTCASPTSCDPSGRCVGCQAAGDCAALPCRDATCTAGVCQYTAGADGAPCGGTRSCCGGLCTSTRTDPENCGGCGQACGVGRPCFSGRCLLACDVCASGCAHTTLQAAVTAAGDGATVTVCPGVYQGQTFIDKNLTVVGLGGDPAATVLTNPTGAIMLTEFPKTVTLRNLTVSGVTSGSNSAIVNQGVMRLESVRVVDNTASANGGGIRNVSVGNVIYLVDSIVRANSAREGGGIYTSGGATVNLIRSRVDDNTAQQGGGIYNNSGAVNVTDNSVVTGNTATGSNGIFGGGILNAGAGATLTVASGGSITGNTPDDCADSLGSSVCPP